MVWIGNWGDDERSGEIRKFFIEPLRRLHLSGVVYEVRYPNRARRFAVHGGETVLSRHTCRHRVEELLDICREFGPAR